MAGPPIFPVANPTWYDTIRHMFTSTDVAHMSSMGLDLTSYDSVKVNAGPIYGQVSAKNMPPGNPWTGDMTQTFLNWYSNGCPKGAPAVSASPLFKSAGAPATASRIRKDIETLSGSELALLTKAFSAIVALPSTEPNSFFVQAGYHWFPAPLYCQHHVPAYNPWHRAYLLSYENALRSVPGCENVVLPYWDITKPFPDVLRQKPFDAYTLPQQIAPGFPQGYTTSRYSYADIQQNLLQYQVTDDIQRALTKTDWEDFHGFWSGALNNTIIAAHDEGHVSIGPTMANQGVAAFDPVFFFFHANLDRLWWEWQTKVGATNLTGLLSTINKVTDQASYDLFTNPTVGKLLLAPFPELLKLDAVKVIDSVGSLDVDYAPPAGAQSVAAFARKASAAAPLDRAVSIAVQRVTISVEGLNRLKVPGSFSVHLLKDGKRIASRAMFQPNEADQCETCVKNAIAHFDFDLPIQEATGGKLTVEVEPVDQSVVGKRFPNKLLGNPKITVRVPVETD